MTPSIFSLVGAITAGIVAAAIFAVFGRLATLNVMTVFPYLPTVVLHRGRTVLPWVLHFALGALFGLIYAALWAAGVRTPDFYLFGFLVGIAHWLVVRILMAGAPLIHIGIPSELFPGPGLFLRKRMGGWGFMAGLAGHILFGLAFAYFYQFFIYYRP